MKKKIVFSLMILALASTLVGGGTLALFTDEAAADPVTFTTGTVEITGQNLSITSVATDQPENPSQKTLTWCVENTGSKAAYIRVRARGGNDVIQEESAAGAGEKYGNAQWKMYFSYNPNVEQGKSVDFLASNSRYYAGEVNVNHDLENLYVSYRTVNGWTLTETHVYAEKEEPIDEQGSGKDPGNFTSGPKTPDSSTTDLHTISFYKIFDGGPIDTIYLVTHAAVKKLPAQWTLHSDNTSWIANEDNDDDNWWYHTTPVPAGETVCISLNVQHYDSEVEYYLEAEAVQASHNAIREIWQDPPL